MKKDFTEKQMFDFLNCLQDIANRVEIEYPEDKFYKNFFNGKNYAFQEILQMLHDYNLNYAKITDLIQQHFNLINDYTLNTDF